MSDEKPFMDGCFLGCAILMGSPLFLLVFLLVASKWGFDGCLISMCVAGVIAICTQIARHDPQGWEYGFALKDVYIPEANKTSYINDPPKVAKNQTYTNNVCVYETVMSYNPETGDYMRVQHKVESNKRTHRNNAVIGKGKSKRYQSIATYPYGTTPVKGKLKVWWGKLEPLPPIPKELIVQKLEPLTKQQVIDQWNAKVAREKASFEAIKKANPGVAIQQAPIKRPPPPPPPCPNAYLNRMPERSEYNVPPLPPSPCDRYLYESAHVPTTEEIEESLLQSRRKRAVELLNKARTEALLTPDGPIIEG
jgi:hypothetical protein